MGFKVSVAVSWKVLKMRWLKRNPSATDNYRMAKILLKLGCVRNFIYLPYNKKDNTYRTATMKLNIFLGPFGDKATWSCIFPVLGKWAFLLYLKCYLYLSFHFSSLLRPLFLWMRLSSLYQLAFYFAKVWRFCQIPNTRPCLIRLKLFWKAFRKCRTFGYSKKLSTELFGVLTLGKRHLFMHVKRLYDDEMTEW